MSALTHEEMAELIALSVRSTGGDAEVSGGSSAETMIDVTDPRSGASFVVLVRPAEEDDDFWDPAAADALEMLDKVTYALEMLDKVTEDESARE